MKTFFLGAGNCYGYVIDLTESENSLVQLKSGDYAYDNMNLLTYPHTYNTDIVSKGLIK